MCFCHQVAIIAGNFELAELIKNHKETDIGEWARPPTQDTFQIAWFDPPAVIPRWDYRHLCLQRDNPAEIRRSGEPEVSPRASMWRSLRSIAWSRNLRLWFLGSAGLRETLWRLWEYKMSSSHRMTAEEKYFFFCDVQQLGGSDSSLWV